MGQGLTNSITAMQSFQDLTKLSLPKTAVKREARNIYTQNPIIDMEIAVGELLDVS